MQSEKTVSHLVQSTIAKRRLTITDVRQGEREREREREKRRRRFKHDDPITDRTLQNEIRTYGVNLKFHFLF